MVKFKRLGGRLVPLLVAGAILPVHSAVATRPPFVEISNTGTGRAIAAEYAAHARDLSRSIPHSRLRIWELGPGDYFLADRLPLNLATTTETDPVTGGTSHVVSFDVEGRLRSPRTASTTLMTAASPYWLWLDSYCFGRKTVTWGWMDSCYSLRGMVGESDSRDFYSLNHFATYGAIDKTSAKLYSAFVDAVPASKSAPMSWIDWSPRSSLSGNCQTVPLSVSALGISFSTSGFMCERWIISKSATPGKLRTTWSCSCFFGYGVPFPETRQAEYMQAVSVAGGRVPYWTLSFGIHASN